MDSAAKAERCRAVMVSGSVAVLLEGAEARLNMYLYSPYMRYWARVLLYCSVAHEAAHGLVLACMCVDAGAVAAWR